MVKPHIPAMDAGIDDGAFSRLVQLLQELPPAGTSAEAPAVAGVTIHAPGAINVGQTVIIGQQIQPATKP